MKSVALLCVAACAATSCAQIEDWIHPDETVTGSAEVGAQGFGISIDDFVVTGPAGVAPVGSTVTVTTHTRDRFEDVAQFGDRIGNTVEVVLNDGTQPDQPITVSTVLPDGAVPAGTQPLAVTDAVGGGIEVVETSYDPSSRIATATMTHLSHLQFLGLDFGALGSFVGDSIREFFGFGDEDAPDCVGESVDLGGRTLTAGRAKNSSGEEKNAAWPCLAVDGNRLKLSFEANSNVSWMTYTDPTSESSYTTGSGSADVGAQAIYRTLLATGKERTAGYLTPDGTVTHTFQPNEVPDLAGLRISAGLGVTANLVYMLDAAASIFGISTKTIDLLQNSAGGMDCLQSAIDTADTSTKSPGESAGSMFTAELACLGAVATGPFAFLIGVIGGGAGAIVSSFTGAVTELVGDRKQFVDIVANGSTSTAEQAQYFRSPTGNVQCQMGDSPSGTWGGWINKPAVGCLAVDYTGTNVAVECDTSTLTANQRAAALGPSGEPVRTICTGGQPFSRSPSGEFPVLDYGQTARWGTFSCTSDYTRGVLCSDSTTGNGFSISRDNIVITGNDATRYAAQGANDSPMDAELGLYTSVFSIRGIRLALLPDGAGSLRRDSGATDTATWPLTWDHTGTARARIVLGTPTLSTNTPSAVNDDFQAGATYDLAIRESPLTMTFDGPISGTGRSVPPLCPDYDRSGCDE